MMARSFVVLHCQKLKTLGDVAGLGKHNERGRATPNADPERTVANERLAGTGDWLADVKRRLDDAPTIRSNAVLAISHVLSASREWFEAATPARVEAWRDKSIVWLRDTYGAANVVAAVLHRDETTLHIQAMVVPIDERGKLNASHWLDGRAKMQELQTGYARAVEDLGLVRGIKGSAATHEDMKEYYRRLDTPAREIERALDFIEIGTPPRLGNLGAWKAQEKERIVEQVRPAVDAALTQATHHRDRAERAEATATTLQRTVDALQAEQAARERRDIATQARRLDLRDVAANLGGEQDPRDKPKWRIDGQHYNLSTDGHAFYNLDRGQGKGGAIDFVVDVTGYSVKDAIGWLKETFGIDRATAAAVERATPTIRAEVEQSERPPFQAPVHDEAAWGQVRNYLVHERGLPGGMVDALHDRGTVYADGRCNAVFLRTDGGGHTTGASLRGTAPGSAFTGLARDTDRQAGWFTYSVGEQTHAWETPTLVIAESPIDALSWLAMRERPAGHAPQAGRITVVSTDGLGPLPEALIATTRAERGLVVAAFDRDATGERFWETVRGRYPNAPDITRDAPPAGKDWNDALHAARYQQNVGRDRDGHERGR